MAQQFFDINEGVPIDQTGNDPWREMGIDLDPVRVWIASQVSGRVLYAATPEVLNRKEWSLVARFGAHAEDAPADVVYKATLLPEFRHGPAIFSLLTRTCPGETPHLMAWRETEGRAEMLFRPFSGRSVQEAGDIEPLMQMATAMGRIQSRVGELPPAEKDGLPRLPVRDVPDLLDDLVVDIANIYQG